MHKPTGIVTVGNSSSKFWLISTLPFLYWIYLTLTTQMVIAQDAIGYEGLARHILERGMQGYFASGPHREPLYPLVVSYSMRLGEFFGIPYQAIQRIFQVSVLVLTYILTAKILQKLKLAPIIFWVTLIYFGFSPAIVNFTFSLYSETFTYAPILGILLAAPWAWGAIHSQKLRTSSFAGVILGVLFLLITFVKASYEIIFFAFLIPFFFLALQGIKKNNRPLITATLAFLTSFLITFQTPVTTYKWLNKHHNGSYTLTDRGAWAIYGSFARRAEQLTPRHIRSGFSYVAGENFCNTLFGQEECYFWSPKKSDMLGLKKFHEATKIFPQEDVDSTLYHAALQKALERPFQFVFFTVLDGLKLFFWESTKMGFVSYPTWLQNIFDFTLFKNGLRLVTSIFTLGAFIFTFCYLINTRRKIFITHDPEYTHLLTILFSALIVSTHIGLYSLFNTVPRFVMPVAPIFLILIAFTLNEIFKKLSRS